MGKACREYKAVYLGIFRKKEEVQNSIRAASFSSKPRNDSPPFYIEIRCCVVQLCCADMEGLETLPAYIG